MIRALLLLAILVTGCASPYVPMTAINVSPDLSPEQIEDVIAAADALVTQADLDPLPIRVSNDKRGGWVGPAKSAKCDGKPRVAWTSVNLVHAPRVHLCMDRLDGVVEFRAVVMHELGHALARRGYHLGPGNVMAERVNDFPEDLELTPADVEYVRGGS